MYGVRRPLGERLFKQIAKGEANTPSDSHLLAPSFFCPIDISPIWQYTGKKFKQALAARACTSRRRPLNSSRH
jgi:hypothetical protein